MIKSATFEGEIKDGRLTYTNQYKYDLYIKALTGLVRVKISKVKKARTTGAPGEKSNMNGYYWLYLAVIEKETGHLATELHEYFKRILLPPRFLSVLGKTIKIPGTTTDCSGVEMMELMEKINGLTEIPIPPHPDEAPYSDEEI